MYIEIAALTSLIVVLTIGIGELTKMKGLGLIAGVLLLFLAYWIYGDGLQIQSSEITSITSSATTDPMTNITVTTTTQNQTAIYTPIPATPFVDMTNIYAFCSLLFGLYVIVHYAMDMVYDSD